MIRITPDEIRRWRVEIDQAEKFRTDEFGSIVKSNIKGAGENISYFEKGFSGRFEQEYGLKDNFVSMNVVYPIVKNVIPTLYYKNPYVLVLPKRKEDEDSSPYVSAILNYYFNELDIKSVNQHIIFDAYVLGMGVCKVGYATQFGSDIPDDNLERERNKRKKQGILEKLGLKKPKEEEKKENIELNEYIRSESPYSIWVSPFNFGIDPKATSIFNASYVYEKVTKTLDSVKSNPNYSNTDDLEGSEIEKSLVKDMPQTEIEKFKTIDLYEIHYKQDDGIYILVLAKDQGDYVALRHEKSIYEMDGFQYEILAFNKHGHKLYPCSDVSVFKGLEDRINITFDNILDQVDKFVSKLGVDETALTEGGKMALESGELGAVVYTNKTPSEVFKEISLNQVKGDMVLFIDKLVDTVSLITGVTRSMLTGMTSAETATEAQIGQAGSNLRLSDKADMVQDFSNRQARKLWQVIRQFVDLEELQLITGEQGYDDVTGTPRYKWLGEITPMMNGKLTKGEYGFRIEVGSTQKPDLPILRKQVENMANILSQPGVLQAFQMQGYKIELAEIFRRYLMLFPDVFRDIGRIIKPIQQGTTGLLPMMPQGGGGAGQQLQEKPPNMADIISQIGGEKGGNPPIA